MKSVGFLLIVILLFLCGTADAERIVWYVHPDSALNTIQAGLNSCADNDVVLVAPSTYVEHIFWPNTQGIHLISELGPYTTIIDGDSTGRVITINTGVDTTTVIRGFTIRNGVASSGGGILCSISSSVTIADNIILNNCANAHPREGGGIYCIRSNIYNNVIEGNVAGYGGGIYSSAGGEAVIIGNVIKGNLAYLGLGGGIYFWGEAVIIGNTISNNTGAGIYYDAEEVEQRRGNTLIAHNVIGNNTDLGIYAGSSPSLTTSRKMSNNIPHIRSFRDSILMITGNIITGNTGEWHLRWCSLGEYWSNYT